MSTSGSPGSVARRGIGALLACASATALVLATAPAGNAAPPQQGEISFPGSVPAWATDSADAGATPADTTVEGEVYLPLRDEQGAQALATAVSTPGNPQYGRYLSAKQWIKQFSPTKADFQAVEDYLTSSGLTIYAEPASRQYIVFRGPASTVGPAFGTTLHEYHYAGGLQHAGQRPVAAELSRFQDHRPQHRQQPGADPPEPRHPARRGADVRGEEGQREAAGAHRAAEVHLLELLRREHRPGPEGLRQQGVPDVPVRVPA